MREVLPGKYASEAKDYIFDFSSLTPPGDGILGATGTISLYSGTVGALPTLTVGSPSNNVSIVQVFGGLVANIYVIVVTGTSSTGQIVNLNAFLPILPGQP